MHSRYFAPLMPLPGVFVKSFGKLCFDPVNVIEFYKENRIEINRNVFKIIIEYG